MVGDAKMLTGWTNNYKPLPLLFPFSPVPDLRAVVSCSAIAAGQQSEFDFALAQYREIVNSEPNYLYSPLRTMYMNSLACATDEDILNG
jgi:hypothetical protein